MSSDREHSFFNGELPDIFKRYSKHEIDVYLSMQLDVLTKQRHRIILSERNIEVIDQTNCFCLVILSIFLLRLSC
jgi:3-deoxy-D-arabino-heptulosonate 7-phosphate (DAHP) synthase